NDGDATHSVFVLIPSVPSGVDPMDMMNNVIYLSPGSQTSIMSFAAASTNVAYIYNNIFEGGSASGSWPTNDASVVFDYNLYAAAHLTHEPSDLHKFTGDPKFVSPTTLGIGLSTTTGLKLQNSSPAISAGTNTSYVGTSDFWGDTFGAYPATPFIGAYTTRDLAAGAAVSYSSTYDGSPWNHAYATDQWKDSGGTDYGYSSQVGVKVSHHEYIEIDLAGSQTFNEVTLFPRNDTGQVGVGFPINFTIQVWNGLTWLTRVTETSYPRPGNQPQVFSWGFSDTTNKIRIDATTLGPDANGDYVMQFAEIELHQN
ncbi:MAG TPA: discoidin domain-containing protein, partial [Kofleriaceae bacterium]|nr:discoidin domain-containing protein [Kofleriaceae bacterium]